MLYQPEVPGSLSLASEPKLLLGPGPWAHRLGLGFRGSGFGSGV